MEAVIKIKTNVFDYVEIRVSSVDETPAAVRDAQLEAIHRAGDALSAAWRELVGYNEVVAEAQGVVDENATAAQVSSNDTTSTTSPEPTTPPAEA